MTKLKAIMAAIGFAILMVLGAFGLGSMRGREKAEAKADKQRTDDNAAATVAVAERRTEVTKEASNVQQTVNHMPDDAVDCELRNDWTRPGSR
jgi:membrane protein required for beta-lactamase induction